MSMDTPTGWFTTIDGLPFDPAEPIWHVSTPTMRVRFEFALPGASEALRASIRAAVAEALRHKPPEKVRRWLADVCGLICVAVASRGTAEVDGFGLADVDAFKAAWQSSQPAKVNQLVDALGGLVLAGLDRVEKELVMNLPQYVVRLPVRSSPARRMCPDQGALAPAELAEAMGRLGSAAATGAITPCNFAVCMLTATLLARPAQVALMKVSDLTVTNAPGKPTAYVLKIPRVKQRRVGRKEREVTIHCLDPRLGAVLEAQCRRAIEWGASKGIAAGDCPMVPRDARRPGDKSIPELPGMVGHSASTSIRARLKRSFHNINLTSSATGKRMRIPATRLRRTHATIARSQGLSLAQVGAILLHPNGGTAWIYSEPTVEMIRRIEAAADSKATADLYRAALGRRLKGGTPGDES